MMLKLRQEHGLCALDQLRCCMRCLVMLEYDSVCFNACLTAWTYYATRDAVERVQNIPGICAVVYNCVVALLLLLMKTIAADASVSSVRKI